MSPRGTPTSVVLAGGGSAGHISPLLALADALRRRWPQVRLTVLGTTDGLEQRLVPARGYDLRLIPKVVFPRRPGGAVLALPGALGAARRAAAQVLCEAGADVLVGFGGYVSSPAYLAARARRTPVVVHEQNARPGLANRLGARLTPYVGTTFPGTPLPHAQVVGLPLRSEITALDRPAQRAEALAHFGLADTRPTLLVTGGSLGAQRLNHTFAGCARVLTRAGIQVLHLFGEGKSFTPDPAPEGAAYLRLPYTDRMDLAYAAADLVLARAGANTVCELACVGLPAVLVPLPIGNGEQRLNARAVVAAGGALLVDDDALSEQWVQRRLLPLARDPGRLQAMAQAAAEQGSRNADERLADLVQQAYDEVSGR